MFAQVHKPENLSGEELDDYLNQGWFRNGQRIFTTNFLNFDNHIYSAIWLRIELQKYEVSKTFQKLSKLNRQFKITIQPASITPEKENLFQEYRSGVSFSASQSLQVLLYSDSENDVYNTYEVLLHDNDVLIGVGYFDLGDTSAAGIISFYNLEYKKYSLGKYLISLKVNYCKQLNFKYFYPGYFAPNYPAFDYKLTIGKEQLQYLQLSTQTWLALDSFNLKNNPYEIMVEKLNELQVYFNQSRIKNSIYKYTFFEANIIPNLVGLNLFDFPVFLMCFDEVEDVVNPMVVYDVSNHCFHLVVCKSVWKTDHSINEIGFYSSDLLKLKKHICSTSHADEMFKIIATATSNQSNTEK